MADVKWIKITVDMFDNRKIKHLRKLPEGNNIVLIWVMLLTMAGRCNASGMIFLTQDIPYTPKMLADELGFEENTVQLALQALEHLGMVNTDHGCFAIAGWAEHQNIEGMEKIREQNRIRKQRQRKIKNISAQDENLLPEACHVTSRDSHAIDIDIDKDIEIDKENKNDICAAAPTTPTSLPKKQLKHKYGEYGNVLLSDPELDKLKTEFADWAERIERLSAYVASTGKRYKSHYATIKNWARKDQENGKAVNHGLSGTDGKVKFKNDVYI